jgi:hypothetical protein
LPSQVLEKRVSITAREKGIPKRKWDLKSIYHVKNKNEKKKTENNPTKCVISI